MAFIQQSLLCAQHDRWVRKQRPVVHPWSGVGKGSGTSRACMRLSTLPAAGSRAATVTCCSILDRSSVGKRVLRTSRACTSTAPVRLPRGTHAATRQGALPSFGLKSTGSPGALRARARLPHLTGYSADGHLTVLMDTESMGFSRAARSSTMHRRSISRA